jgi:hypothetical protein
MVFYCLQYITVVYGKQVMQDTGINNRMSFSSTSSLCSSVNVGDQVSHPYKTRDKIIILGILVSIFLDSKREHKRFLDQMVVGIA